MELALSRDNCASNADNNDDDNDDDDNDSGFCCGISWSAIADPHYHDSSPSVVAQNGSSLYTD